MRLSSRETGPRKGGFVPLRVESGPEGLFHPDLADCRIRSVANWYISFGRRAIRLEQGEHRS